MGPDHLKGCPALISGGINQVCLPMDACSPLPQSRQWQVLHLIKTGAVKVDLHPVGLAAGGSLT